MPRPFGAFLFPRIQKDLRVFVCIAQLQENMELILPLSFLIVIHDLG